MVIWFLKALKSEQQCRPRACQNLGAWLYFPWAWAKLSSPSGVQFRYENKHPRIVTVSQDDEAKCLTENICGLCKGSCSTDFYQCCSVQHCSFKEMIDIKWGDHSVLYWILLSFFLEYPKPIGTYILWMMVSLDIMPLLLKDISLQSINLWVFYIYVKESECTVNKTGEDFKVRPLTWMGKDIPRNYDAGWKFKH